MTWQTVDYHTAGEPFRIVTGGAPPLPGATVAERRARAITDPDAQRVRQLLCQEPRGHADMYGGFLVPPDDDGAHLGVLFWHKDGFSTACGHGTIALATWAVETALVPRTADGPTEVVVDVPSGRVRALVRSEGERVVEATFVNVPSWVRSRGVEVVTSRGTVRVDVAFGGAMYAVLPASDVGLDVAPSDYADLIALGRQIRDDLNARHAAEHPEDPRLSGIYGTIFTAPGEHPLHQRNCTVFADGEVDRSPCGSGTAARVALLADDGTLGEGEVLLHDSIVGTRFEARVQARTVVHGRPAVVPAVTGSAYRVATCEFTVDPHDPVVPGFVLR
ncbi:proline racemase family protein [Ornithinimicrobium avium]|uniref:Proline racemase n=1 Tax=Ornithinimicrobium avium TaxID=2283195 RepID=A0A345NJC1_9MICO|nr:proline racemase family protein [Ornithinimicrobium avium]AXH95129.1 proline racemase [Ornithinimicrobium avium]